MITLKLDQGRFESILKIPLYVLIFLYVQLTDVNYFKHKYILAFLNVFISISMLRAQGIRRHLGRGWVN